MTYYKEFYRYVLNNVNIDEEKLPFSRFKNILNTVNDRVLEELLQGKVFSMKYKLSMIKIVKIENNFKKLRIDWHKSKILKNKYIKEGIELYNKETKEGKKWYVYFDQKYYYRYYWYQNNSSISNCIYYQFKPSYKMKNALINKINNDPYFENLFIPLVAF